ncbi:MAG: NUDIX domain-containing protein [Fimbriimonadales bacterium]
MKRFPSGKYGRQTLTFHPAPFRAPLRAFAGLVFPWQEERVLLCDILGRGWCIPSGRVEPEEESIEAVRREALEEAGAYLDNLQYIGCYQILERNETRWADCFTASVADLTDIQITAESRAREFYSMEQLPSIYHVWNELTDQVFRHAFEVYSRLRAM